LFYLHVKKKTFREAIKLDTHPVSIDAQGMLLKSIWRSLGCGVWVLLANIGFCDVHGGNHAR
jgi:hypothetical protein